MKKNLIVMQEGSNDCGGAALLSIIRYYGGDISLNRLIEMTMTTKEGTNFYNISLAASNLGLASRSYKVDEVVKIKSIPAPFISQLQNKNGNHFVVVYKVINDKVLIMDPAKGKYTIDLFDFSTLWTGYIMLFEKVKELSLSYSEKVLNKVLVITLIKNKKIIFSLITLSFIITILSCLSSLYSQTIFDKIIDTSTNNLIVMTFLFSILFIIKNITSFIRNYLLIILNQKIDVSVIISTFSKIILLPYTYYKNRSTSEVLSRINDLSSIKNFISKIIITLFLDILMFIVSFIIIYNISKKITLILIIISLVYLISILIFNPILKKLTILNQENIALVNNSIIESVSSFETIKGLNIEDNTILKFSRIYSRGLNNTYKTEKVNNILLSLKELIGDLGILFLSYFCFHLIMNNKLTIGDYMTTTILMIYLVYPIKNIIELINEYHYTKNSLKRANNLLEIEEEKIYDNKKLTIMGDIVIKNLTYTFNNKYNILNNLNFRVKEREKILILGPSGGGKSTILKILYKYYKVDRNQIFINNYDINDYSMSDIRKNIIYVSQNELLYEGSIRNNILLERKIEEEKYLDICKLVYINDIVKDNLLGYDYILEENGVNLSGGQRQRIILARSLLKESSIIMIDEGLNQIDIELERKILQNIFYYFKSKTFIIVSHRKENLDLYDQVINIKNGQAEESLGFGKL